MLRRCLLVLAMVTSAIVWSSGPALACPPGSVPSPDPELGVICIPASDPGDPGSPPDPAPENPGGGGPTTCHKASGEEVPCSNADGVWWPEQECYARQLDLPMTHPAWRGHTDGTLWLCTVNTGPNTGSSQYIWLPPGAGVPGAAPDPGELAKTAMGQLRLETAQVHTAPQHPARTIVRVENWMWVPESQWATLTKTVTAGGTSVTVTAEPERILWDMGPETKTCYAPGREWRDGMTDAAKTNCGYAYEVTSHFEPGGVFELSATIQYRVDWVCSGACTSGSGSLGLVDAPAGTGTLRVLQRQTVVVR